MPELRLSPSLRISWPWRRPSGADLSSCCRRRLGLLAFVSRTISLTLACRCRRLLKKLEAIGWPAPLKERLDGFDSKANEFKDAFADLLELEKMYVRIEMYRHRSC